MTDETAVWLCRKCSDNQPSPTLAGTGLSCAECGKYAVGAYRRVNGEYKAAVVGSGLV